MLVSPEYDAMAPTRVIAPKKASKSTTRRYHVPHPTVKLALLLAHAYNASLLYGLAIGITMWFSSDASRAPSVLPRTSWPSILPQSCDNKNCQ